MGQVSIIVGCYIISLSTNSVSYGHDQITLDLKFVMKTCFEYNKYQVRPLVFWLTCFFPLWYLLQNVRMFQISQKLWPIIFKKSAGTYWCLHSCTIKPVFLCPSAFDAKSVVPSRVSFLTGLSSLQNSCCEIHELSSFDAHVTLERNQSFPAQIKVANQTRYPSVSIINVTIADIAMFARTVNTPYTISILFCSIIILQGITCFLYFWSTYSAQFE